MNCITRRPGTLVPAVIAAVMFLCTASAVSAADAVVRIGDRQVSVSEFESRATELLRGGYPHLQTIDMKAKQQLLDGVIAQELLIAEGLRRNLAADPSIAPDLERTERRALMNALYDSLALQKEYSSTEEELRAYFAEAQYDVEVLSRHIVCATEEEGRQVLAALEAGTPFEALVKEHSRRSIQDRFGPGGWVGWFRIGELYDELQEPLKTMQPGQFYPEPVRTSLGYHVFGLQARRPTDFDASLEFIREQLRVQKRANDMEAYVNRLRQQYNIKLVDQSLMSLATIGLQDSSWTGAPVAVATWNGGQLGMEDFMSLVRAGRSSHPARLSTEQLHKEVDNQAGVQVMMTEARRLGFDRLPAVREKIRDKQLQLFGAWFFLHEGKAQARPDTSAANVRRFYDQNQDLFTRTDSTVAGFELVRASIRNLLVQQAETSAMDSFLAGLRKRYARDIHIDRKALKRAVVQRPAKSPTKSTAD